MDSFTEQNNSKIKLGDIVWYEKGHFETSCIVVKLNRIDYGKLEYSLIDTVNFEEICAYSSIDKINEDSCVFRIGAITLLEVDEGGK